MQMSGIEDTPKAAAFGKMPIGSFDGNVISGRGSSSVGPHMQNSSVLKASEAELAAFEAVKVEQIITDIILTQDATSCKRDFLALGIQN